MKITVYIVIFTSYSENGEYLRTESQTFTSPESAQNYYDKQKQEAIKTANGYKKNMGREPKVTEIQWADTRKFNIKRHSPCGYGYQAEVKMEAAEIDLPQA